MRTIIVHFAIVMLLLAAITRDWQQRPRGRGFEIYITGPDNSKRPMQLADLLWLLHLPALAVMLLHGNSAVFMRLQPTQIYVCRIALYASALAPLGLKWPVTIVALMLFHDLKRLEDNELDVTRVQANNRVVAWVMLAMFVEWLDATIPSGEAMYSMITSMF